MVKLTKIYTRTGDDGTTGLGDATRVSKTDARVEAYGTVDEANSAVGVALATISASPTWPWYHREIGLLLTTIQNDLFDLGADLCCPITDEEEPGSRLRVTLDQTRRLETAIDAHNERLAPLNSFILPGGSTLSAALHMARTICRRAERCTVLLAEREPEQTNAETVRYLNRLSDLLFVLCRVANDHGSKDVLWVPGAHRAKEKPAAVHPA